MNALILGLHIAIACLLTVAALRVLYAGWARHQTRVHSIMMVSFAGTVLSGVSLLFVGIGGIGRICLTMTAVTFATLLVSRYYRARILSTSL
jgi:phosphoglycerate dehydrogenase-like enzyme